MHARHLHPQVLKPGRAESGALGLTLCWYAQQWGNLLSTPAPAVSQAGLQLHLIRATVWREGGDMGPWVQPHSNTGKQKILDERRMDEVRLKTLWSIKIKLTVWWEGSWSLFFTMYNILKMFHLLLYLSFRLRASHPMCAVVLWSFYII